MINGHTDLVSSPFSGHGFGPDVYGGTTRPDPLREHLWALSLGGPFAGVAPGVATPELLIVQQLQQAAQTIYQQADSHLSLLRAQLLPQIVQNPVSAPWLLDSFFQQVRQIVLATQLQILQHLPVVAQSTVLLTSGRAAGQVPGAGMAPPLRDEEITAYLNQVLEINPITANAEIEIDCKNRVVTLRGVVLNKQAKQIAEMLAWQIPGVTDVQDNVEIKSRRKGQLARETVKPGR